MLCVFWGNVEAKKKFVPLCENASWDFVGIRISADRSETTRYNYNETIIGTRKIGALSYYILRGLSDEDPENPSFTLIRESNDSIFTILRLEDFGEFELLISPGLGKKRNLWRLMKDTVFVWQEDGLFYHLKFCGLGVFRGEKKLSTRFGRKKTFIVDNIYSQELVITDAEGDTLLWDNKEELHQLYLVPGLGPVKNTEIDAIGTTRIEELNSYSIPKWK
ncbi:MAG: hypothetical protein ACPL6C_01890 [bacterium]